MRRAAIALSAALMVLFGTAPARAEAPAVKSCPLLAEEGQRLRADGRLIEAREKLTACSVPECPEVIRADCASWASEVLAATPTIVVDAKDASGADVADGQVLVDHKVVAKSIDGRAVTVNPGTRVVEVQRPNGESAYETIDVKENTKWRQVTVTFGAATHPQPARSTRWSGFQYAGVAGAIIGAGLITYGIVGFMSYTNDEANLKERFNAADDAAKASSCVPQSPPESTCGKTIALREDARRAYDENESDAKSARGLWLGAGVVGLILVAGGAVLIIAGPRASSSARVTPIVGPTFGGFATSASF